MKSFYPSFQAVSFVHGGPEAPNLFGRVEFYQKGTRVLVIADIDGLPEGETGFFGLHIHEGASCAGTDFSESKAHYNPDAAPHPSHAGDLPPLLHCGTGAYMEVMTDRFFVSDVIGKTVVIHSSPDDFYTQPSGNAGKKIACGIIKKR